MKNFILTISFVLSSLACNHEEKRPLISDPDAEISNNLRLDETIRTQELSIACHGLTIVFPATDGQKLSTYILDLAHSNRSQLGQNSDLGEIYHSCIRQKLLEISQES